MENAAVHPVVLNFADTSVEKAFIQEYYYTIVFFSGITFIFPASPGSFSIQVFTFPTRDIFIPALIILISVLLIPFIIVVSLSFFKKYSTLNHHITAFCNFGAACVCIYVAIYLSKDLTFLCAGVVCINFFCYFILRIRFKVSLAVTFSYSMIAQYCVLESGNFSDGQIYASSSGIWLGFFTAMIAGYFFEKTNRKIFVQNKLLEEQYAERDRTRERVLLQAKEIEKAYNDLKSTQAQLIQSEKMASLGELTAGIAHEIQNPLNFVNNFSEVNKELLTEMKEEIDKGNLAEVKTIAKM